ncbi:MAG: hypothetical protein IJK77_01370 [Lachnospiraceae bacterium]|nr:hypothetical protein [Lachnospiraceae bacterium]
MKALTRQKIAVFAAAVFAAIGLAACAKKPAVTEPATETGTEAAVSTAAQTLPDSSSAPQAAFDESDLILAVDGVELKLGMDFVPAADKILGGVYDEQVGQACVVGGNDRNYYYGGEAVCVYTVGSADGGQSVYDIYITLSDGFATPKGAVIGKSTRDEVLALYGEPASASETSVRYTADGRQELIFGFDGEVLSSVGLHDNEVR